MGAHFHVSALRGRMLDAHPLSNPTLSGKIESLHRESEGVFLVCQQPDSLRPLAPSVECF